MTTQQRRLVTAGAVTAAVVLLAIGTYFFAGALAGPSAPRQEP